MVCLTYGLPPTGRMGRGRDGAVWAGPVTGRVSLPPMGMMRSVGRMMIGSGMGLMRPAAARVPAAANTAAGLTDTAGAARVALTSPPDGACCLLLATAAPADAPPSVTTAGACTCCAGPALGLLLLLLSALSRACCCPCSTAACAASSAAKLLNILACITATAAELSTTITRNEAA